MIGLTPGALLASGIMLGLAASCWNRHGTLNAIVRLALVTVAICDAVLVARFI